MEESSIILELVDGDTVTYLDSYENTEDGLRECEQDKKVYESLIDRNIQEIKQIEIIGNVNELKRSQKRMSKEE